MGAKGCLFFNEQSTFKKYVAQIVMNYWFKYNKIN